MTLNIFLLKYLLSEDLISHITENSNITNVRFDATSTVTDPKIFFSKISTSSMNDYAKFTEEVVRCEVGDTVLYVFFRTSKETRPDLGANKYTFAKPSSVEIGCVDAQGAFDSFYKVHYSTIIQKLNIDLGTATKNDIKVLTKSIEYDIINAILGWIHVNMGINIPCKPVDSTGRAIITAAPPKAKVSNTTNNNSSNYNSDVQKIADKI